MKTKLGSIMVIAGTGEAEASSWSRTLMKQVPSVICRDSDGLADSWTEAVPALVCLLSPPNPATRRILSNLRQAHGVPVLAVSKGTREPWYENAPEGSRITEFPNPDIFCETIYQYLTDPGMMEPEHVIQEMDQVRQSLFFRPEEPSNRITTVVRLLSRLLPDSTVLYNRITGNTLETVSAWPRSIPTGIPVPAEGHLCNDTVTFTKPVFREVHGLEASGYAETDPLVRQLGAQTYVARNVFCQGRPTGSLCALFPDMFVPSKTQRLWIELLADLLGQEEERTASEQMARRYRDLLDNLPVGIYRTTPDGRILEVNRELVRLLGYPDRSTLLTANVNDMFTDRSDRASWIATLEHRGTHHHARYVTKRYDGSVIWVEDHGRAVTDENGHIRWFEGTMVDATERVELEQNLYMVQKLDAIGRLAGGFAHEFNNLLTVVNGYAEMMLSQMTPADPHRDQAAAILKAGQRAAHLISQLLAYGQKQMIQPVVVHPKEKLAALADMIGKLAGERIQVSMTIDGPLPDIKADPRQLEQVILNLAHNSISAIRERPDRAQGTLAIHAESVHLAEAVCEGETTVEAGSYLRITVSDTGVGIHPDVRPLIFEPFFTTRDVGQGTGLGLSTVYGILKQNGGAVTLETHPGKGSAFRVYWPALPPAPSA